MEQNAVSSAALEVLQQVGRVTLCVAWRVHWLTACWTLPQVANVEARLSGDAQAGSADSGLCVPQPGRCRVHASLAVTSPLCARRNDLLQSLTALRRAGGECDHLVLPADVVR